MQKKIIKYLKFIFLFNFVFKNIKPSPGNIVLIEAWLNFEWLLPNIELLKSLCKITNSKPAPFVNSGFGKLLLCSLIFNKNIFLSLTHIFNIRGLFKYNNLWNELKLDFSKEKIFNYKYKGLDIGLDIYQSYLRLFNKVTVDVPSHKLKSIFIEALLLADKYENIFNTNRVSGIIVSHADYHYNNVICKIGYKYGVPIFLISSNRIIVTSKPFHLTDLYHDYKDIFSKFSQDQKKQCQNFGKKFIQKRLKGGLAKELPYITNSIFTNNSLDFDKIIIKKIKKNKDLNIIIFVHDFYDSPHSYGKLRYPDFYEWLNYILQELIKVNCNIFIKTHIDASQLTINETEKFLKIYPNKISLLSKETKINELIDLADLVVTAYGTCSTELPYLGLPVLCTDINPFSSFDFVYTLKRDEKLSEVILKKDLWMIKDIKSIQEEIEQYCYLHHKYFFNNLFRDASYLLKRDKIKYKKLRSKLDNFLFKINSDKIYNSILDQDMKIHRF